MENSILIKSREKNAYFISIIAMVLFFANSILNILISNIIYPTLVLKNAFLANDIVNLIIGIPVFAIVFILSVRKIQQWQLCLSGVMLFIMYNQIVYSISIHIFVNKIINIIILVTCIVAYVSIFKAIDHTAVKQKFALHFSNKIYSIIIIILGLLFITKASSVIINNFIGIKTVSLPDLAVSFADIFICIIWFLAGVLLLKKNKFGYSSIIGIYFQSSLLFLCLIGYLIIKPICANIKFEIIDSIVIWIMSLVCFVPYIILMTKKQISDK